MEENAEMKDVTSEFYGSAQRVFGRGLALVSGSLALLDSLLASGGLDNARAAIRTSDDRRALRTALGSGPDGAEQLARGA